jgi:hypothetical protein
MLRLHMSVIESKKPMSTNVCGKSELSDPNIVFDLIEWSCDRLPVFTRLFCVVENSAMEGLVIVMVHDNVGVVIVLEQVVPDFWIGSERVMENKFSLWSILIDKFFDESIEWLKNV